MFIRTERMVLRPAWPEDVNDIVETFRKEDIVRNLALAPLPRTRAEVRAYIDHPHETWLPHLFMTLRDVEGEPIVGAIALVDAGSDAGDDVELRFWIAQRYRGRGYAAEATRALLAQACTLGHRRIVASHFSDNDSTAGALEAAGFRPTGEFRPRHTADRGDAMTTVLAADLGTRASPAFA